jgi:hypothetical protein
MDFVKNAIGHAVAGRAYDQQGSGSQITVVAGEGSTGCAREVGCGDSLGPTYLEVDNLPEAEPLGLEWAKECKRAKVSKDK